jgi:predicted transcriptional regulator YdeE
MRLLQTLLLSCLATTAIADTTLTFTGKKDKVAMKMQFANNMMRATSVGDGSSYMIYNANNTTFTTFITDKKQYFVMDKESIEKLGDVSAMMESILEKQLANIPEAQREMMRGMLEKAVKAQMPKEMPKPSYNFNGKTDSYNGIECEVVIKNSGKKKSKFCVTKYSNLGMNSDEYAVITSFQNTVEKLAQQYGQDNSMDFSSLGDYMPVKYTQEGESGTLKEVNHDKLDSSLFAIPEGYSQMKMPF